MSIKRTILAFLFLLLTLSACEPSAAPTVPPSNGFEDFPATSTVTPTPTITSTRTPTALIPLTGGQIFPEVAVSQISNCRTGPGLSYPLVFTFTPGQTARLMGKYPLSNYLIINSPTGNLCWIWGQYATVTGDINSVPVLSIPPLPSPTFTATHSPQPIIVPTLTPTVTPTFTPTPAPTLTDTPLPSNTPASTTTTAQPTSTPAPLSTDTPQPANTSQSTDTSAPQFTNTTASQPTDTNAPALAGTPNGLAANIFLPIPIYSPYQSYNSILCYGYDIMLAV